MPKFRAGQQNEKIGTTLRTLLVEEAFGEVWRADHGEWGPTLLVIYNGDSGRALYEATKPTLKKWRSLSELDFPGLTKILGIYSKGKYPLVLLEDPGGATVREAFSEAPTTRAAAEVVRCAAETLAHAASRGLAPINITPDTIVNRPGDTDRPWSILPFVPGVSPRVARLADGRYVPPADERATGVGDAFSNPDVFSLGWIWAEAVAGDFTLPHDIEAIEEAEEEIIEDEDLLAMIETATRLSGGRYPVPARLLADAERWLTANADTSIFEELDSPDSLDPPDSPDAPEADDFFGPSDDEPDDAESPERKPAASRPRPKAKKKTAKPKKGKHAQAGSGVSKPPLALIIAGIVFLVFVLGALGINFIVEGVLERRVASQLNEALVELGLDELISFDDVEIGGLYTNVAVSGIEVKADAMWDQISLEQVWIDSSAKELLSLLREEEPSDVYPLTAIRLKGLRFRLPEGGGSFTLKRFEAGVSEPLRRDSLRLQDDRLLEQDQLVHLEIVDLVADLPDLAREMGIDPDLYELLRRIDTFKVELGWDAEEQIAGLKKFKFATPLAKLDISATAGLRGTRLEDMTLANLKTSLELEITPGSQTWGRPDETGRIGFKRLEFEISAESQFEPSNDTASLLADLQRGTSKGRFEIAGFRRELSGAIAREFSQTEFAKALGLTDGRFAIESARAKWELSSRQLSISDAHLKSRYGEGSFVARIDLDPNNPEDARIQEARLTLENLASGLEAIVSDIESEIGEKLPRDKGRIVLNFVGPIGEPRIQGIQSSGTDVIEMAMAGLGGSSGGRASRSSSPWTRGPGTSVSRTGSSGTRTARAPKNYRPPAFEPRTGVGRSRIQERINEANADMRAMATALESFFIDHNEYPSSTLDLTESIDATLAASNPSDDWSLPSFSSASQVSRSDMRSAITTPIAYLRSYISDPFAPTGGRIFPYFTPSRAAGDWIVWSAGPDGDYDLDWRAFETRATDGSVPPADIFDMLYDPTNGWLSNGDLWRSGAGTNKWSSANLRAMLARKAAATPRPTPRPRRAASNPTPRRSARSRTTARATDSGSNARNKRDYDNTLTVLAYSAIALEAYYVENRKYPPSSNHPDYMADKARTRDGAPDFMRPTFAVGQGIPDLMSAGVTAFPSGQYPDDIFTSPLLRYKSLGYADTFKGGEWILWSAGPDRDYDLSWERYRRASPSDRNPPNDILNQAYDPTNGALSNGDIWRTQAGLLKWRGRPATPFDRGAVTNNFGGVVVTDGPVPAPTSLESANQYVSSASNLLSQGQRSQSSKYLQAAQKYYEANNPDNPAFAQVIDRIFEKVSGPSSAGPDTQIAEVRASMRALGRAIERYYVDQGNFPSSGNNVDLMVHVRPEIGSEKFDFGWTTFSKAFPGAPSLTEPKAYINDYPRDPFARSATARTFGYSRTQSKNDWILWSAGPDGDYDVNWQKLFNPGARTLKSIAAPFAFNPARGAKSNGDIIFTREDMRSPEVEIPARRTVKDEPPWPEIGSPGAYDSNYTKRILADAATFWGKGNFQSAVRSARIAVDYFQTHHGRYDTRTLDAQAMLDQAEEMLQNAAGTN